MEHMSGIQEVDLKGFVTKAVQGVFKTMLSMPLELEEPPNIQGVTAGKHIVGTVGFAGAVMGNVGIFVSRQFAREMTAAMLGMTVDDIGSDEEVHDVIGEVCNMVGGDLNEIWTTAPGPGSMAPPSHPAVVEISLIR